MTRQLSALLLCILLTLGIPTFAEDTAKAPVFKDGAAQPILQCTNLRDENYTNEGSDILRFCVYVETDHDTDGDGKADLVEALVQVPRASAEGNFKAGTIYDPTPYGAGTVEESGMDSSKLMNPVPFDYSRLYEPGEKRTPTGSMTTLEAAAIADPQSWNYKVPYSGAPGYTLARVYDYYLVRGFAVVEAGGIGTYGSEGFELCGFDLERDAHACVVEWLTGDRMGNTLQKHTLGVTETGGGLARTKVIEYVKSNTTAKLITFGHGDLANYGGGYEGKDYTMKTEAMAAGAYYDYTIYLQPTSYTFQPGHKAVLVVTGWDPYRAFLDEAYNSGAVADSTLSSDNYAFNIDNAVIELRFPQAAQ